MYKVKPKLQPQFLACDRDAVPLSVIIGKTEVDAGLVKIKDMTRTDAGGGELVPRADMVAHLKRRLGR